MTGRSETVGSMPMNIDNSSQKICLFLCIQFFLLFRLFCVVDLDARPWDFQAEECALRSAVDRFNSRRYDKNSSGCVVMVCRNGWRGRTR